MPYAVIGGDAVAAWASRIDEAAVRNTQDVDILLRAEDFDRARTAMEEAGFVYHQAAGIQFFLDAPDGKFRDAVRILLAKQEVRPEYESSTPDVLDSERGEKFQVILLPALVEMKLNSFRRKDQAHLLDMLEIGLIDSTWPSRFTPVFCLSPAGTSR